MEKFDITNYLTSAEQTPLLFEEPNFKQRAAVIDMLDFQFTELNALLKHRAEKLKDQLEAIDNRLFERLRTEIRTEGYRGSDFKNLVNQYVDLNEDNYAPGYDDLDIFINGLISSQPLPGPTEPLQPEMVFYQKTPARIIFELAEKAQFGPGDVFFDLGSGLGQVTILVHLLTNIAVYGIEFEPAFCNYAGEAAAALHLPEVNFINADARVADYSGGTVFFMYTPFGGEILQSVLELLRKEALLRKIKVITYGPCTAQVGRQSWLQFIPPVHNNPYQLAVFRS